MDMGMTSVVRPKPSERDMGLVLVLILALSVGGCTLDGTVAREIGQLKDGDVRARRAAIKQLTLRRDKRAVNPLILLLQQTRYDGERSAVCDALLAIGEPALLPLTKVVKESQGPTRFAASRAIGKFFKSDAPVSSKTRAEVVDTLLLLCREGELEAKGAAVRTLGWMGDHRAIDDLARLGQHDDAELRGSVADALGHIGSPAGLPCLMKLLDDSDQNVRFWAAQALGTIGDQRSVPLLCKALHAKDAFDRHAAVTALGWVGDVRAVDAVGELLSDPEPYVRQDAAMALGRMPSRRCIKYLARGLLDEDSSVVICCIHALKELVPVIRDTQKDEPER